MDTNHSKGEAMFDPITVITGTGDEDEYWTPSLAHVFYQLCSPDFSYSEPMELDAMALTEQYMRELPLEVRQAYGEALIEAATMFQRKFLWEEV
jgi:hypothetical protein